GEFIQEPLPRVNDVQVGLKMIAELALDLFAFALSEQSIVDEDARELRADRAEQQRRGDRRIDAARESADDPRRSDSFANPLDLFIDEGGDLPGAGAAADGADEVADQFAAVLGVRDLGVELQSIDR